MSDKKNRKIMIGFVALLAVSLVLGCLFGMISRIIQNSIPDMQMFILKVKIIMSYVVPILFLI